jgi:hypothetical protein
VNPRAALAAVLLAGACAAGSMSVSVRPKAYSPALSSTPGIGLTPVFAGRAGEAYDYRWKTNFGSFVSWAPPAYKVLPRGAEVSAGDETLYWTYDPRLSGAAKPVVEISVEVRERESGRAVAWKKVLLDWDGDTARVRE